MSPPLELADEEDEELLEEEPLEEELLELDPPAPPPPDPVSSTTTLPPQAASSVAAIIEEAKVRMADLYHGETGVGGLCDDVGVARALTREPRGVLSSRRSS